MRKDGLEYGALLMLLLLTLSARSVFAHCEIPCGIYDDSMRIDMLAEHITTIEKSMMMIVELSQQKETNYNQLARWVINKENHALHLQDIIWQYFMTQRIKPTEKEDGDRYTMYIKQLAVLHQMLFYAMKAKQTTDLTNVKRLRSLLEEFRTIYFGDEHK